FLALDYARRHGVVTFFDLDYRPYTWTSPEETAIYYKLAAEKCDVIFGTLEEFDRMERFDRNDRHDDAVTARRWFD
ncbi:5-dehydro-2-deoxygluconokinase, partial [Anoxybacillus sp. LAT_38]|nr:5-dehydro-2-deoxygluconokinase [Anoxybacillus sp. LAT_38]